MPEYPLILANNMFKDPSFLDLDGVSSNVSYPLANLLDMTRYTLWKPAASGNKNIRVYMKNLVRNPGAELNTNYWTSRVAYGTATWTFTRNTTTPIIGNGDFKVDFSAGAGGVLVYTTQRFDLKAGKTYYLTCSCKINTVTGNGINFGLTDNTSEWFTDSGFTFNGTNSYKGIAISTVAATFTLIFTPAADHLGCLIGMTAVDVNTIINFDNVRFGEYRNPDTLIIDRGHNLQGMTVKVAYTPSELAGAAWSEPTGNSLAVKNNDYQLLQWTPLTLTYFSPFWRVRIENSTSTIQQISNLWMGQGWTLDDFESGAFDPFAVRTKQTEAETEAGLRRTYFKYSQAFNKINFTNINSTFYTNIQKFFADIRNGRDPFWWLWRPTTYPKEMRYLELNDENIQAPFESPNRRSWEMNADEVGGALAMPD